ncbi:helix-turn-helix transcriptional regulator [Streptomyces kronopolitis]|uniref:helix-turn-helix transcriptional regulator n=1 Tax=Streptomyces kronopolitis TaxID=1612435 RepID=UPI001663AFF6|nr:LuxR family transcriptional regulator [Streptomyces kronopolitis]
MTSPRSSSGPRNEAGEGPATGARDGACPLPGARRHRWPFACRAEELAAFRSHLDSAEACALLLYGPAGVGKSRLAEEFLRHAARAGHRTERVVATAATAALPLGALGHLLPPDAPAHDPVRTFHAAAEALAPPPATGRPRPTVVLVDDLPLLDNASAVLLGHLVRTGVVTLVGTVRTPVPPSDVVESFEHEEGSHRLDLAAFDAAETAELVRGVLGGPVEHATLRTLSHASRGNALVLRELVAGALDSAELVRENGLWHLTGPLAGTSRLTEIVRSRLAGLDARRLRVLELLALCEPLSPDALAHGGHRPEDVEALEEDGLIRVRMDRRRVVCVLDHPLYGQVLRRGIAAPRRRAIYRDQAAHLAELGARRREDALRLATWRLAAGLPVGLETLLPAARMARHVRDYPKVVELLADVPRNDAVLEVLLLRGEAYHHTGRWAEAEDSLSAAERLATSHEDIVTVAMERTQNLYWGLGDTARTLEVNARAATRLDAGGRRFLRVNEAAYRLNAGGVPDALRLLADAEDIAVPRLRLWAQLQRSLALGYAGRTGEAVELAREVHEELVAAEGEQRPGSPSSHASGPAIYRVAALTDAGRGGEARAVGRAAFTQAVAARALAPQIWIAAHLGRCELLAGHLGAAHDWFTESLGLARGHGFRRAVVFAGAGLAAVHAQAGRADRAERELAATGGPDGERQQASWLIRQLALAWQHAARGARPAAQRALLAAAARARATGMASYEGWLLADAARLGAAPEVRTRLAELAADGDSPLAGARARLAAGLADEDHRALRAAAERCARLGADMTGAEAAGEASALAARAGESRSAAAAAVLSRRLLDRCGTDRVSAPLPHRDQARPLTGRERDVAQLAAGGLSSQEIAARLVLSVRTVDNHLQRAYAKLGVSARGELGRALGEWE